MKYIGENLIAQQHAGSKARVDVEKIFAKRYPVYFNISQEMYASVIDKLKFFLSPQSIKLMWRLIFDHTQEIIFMQYPTYYNKIYDRLVRHFILNHDVVLLVHDIDSLRSENATDIKEEVSLLNHSVAIILHNSKMLQEMRKQGLHVPCVGLNLFDYFLPQGFPEQRFTLGNKIAFAGNLAKSTFLNELINVDIGLEFNLYGPGVSESLKENAIVHYLGSYSADEIPYKLKGSFGLVWDGTSLDTCNGKNGHYMKYNNPHKLSLYIAAGLPVIVWKEAAIAEFVEKYNIGLTVNSLHEVKSIIDNLDEATYRNYLSNIHELQRKVTKGYFTSKALNEVESLL